MAAVARLLPSPYNFSSASISFHYGSVPHICIYDRPLIRSRTGVSSLKSQAYNQSFCSVIESNNLDFKMMKNIEEIHCIEEYEKSLQFSQEKLVIVHFSASHYKHNSKIQQFMEGQCSNEVKFRYVMADESEDTRQICRKEKIDKIPHFIFYRRTVKMHEEAGFLPEKLMRNILYYRDDAFSPVVQLQCREDLEKLRKIHRLDDKLIVLIVGKRQCVPCVKIYPDVLKLASLLAGKIVFARIHADENDGCMEMLKEMEVQRAPAFLFLKNGELCGRYVGSCMSSLTREIVKVHSHHIYMSSVPQKQTALLTAL